MKRKRDGYFIGHVMIVFGMLILGTSFGMRLAANWMPPEPRSVFVWLSVAITTVGLGLCVGAFVARRHYSSKGRQP